MNLFLCLFFGPGGTDRRTLQAFTQVSNGAANSIQLRFVQGDGGVTPAAINVRALQDLICALRCDGVTAGAGHRVNCGLSNRIHSISGA